MNKAFEKILEFIDEQIKIEESIAKSENEGHPITHQYGANCMNVIKKFVQKVAEEYNNGWIACSEIDKLPKDGTPVLVQDYDDYYEMYYCETKHGMKGFSDGDWWSSPNNYKVWQPLPEPYKGE